MSRCSSQNAVLQVQNLTVTYGDLKVLSGVCLKVYPNERVFLHGANASGKTTLLHSVLGLVKPQNGRILFEGHDVTSCSPDERVRRGMTILPENRRLFPDLTVEENLRLCGLAGRSSYADRLREAYEDFPFLNEKRHSLVKQLSGGQQQLVSLARCFILNPILFLADDPSAGLDPSRRQWLYGFYFQKYAVASLIVEQHATSGALLSGREIRIEKGRLL